LEVVSWAVIKDAVFSVAVGVVVVFATVLFTAAAVVIVIALPTSTPPTSPPSPPCLGIDLALAVPFDLVDSLLSTPGTATPTTDFKDLTLLLRERDLDLEDVRVVLLFELTSNSTSSCPSCGM
jgi:hypothetical protein